MVTFTAYLKQIYCALLVLLLCAFPSQAEWYPRLETTLSVSITSSISGSEDQILAVGTNGAFYTLESGHLEWIKIQTGVSVDLYTLLSINTPAGNILIASGEEGIVLRSTDGGKNWAKYNLDSGFSVRKSTYLEKTGRIWLAGEGLVLYSSQDLGLSWSRHLLPENTSRVEDIFIIDMNQDEHLVYVVSSSEDTSSTFYIDSRDVIHKGVSLGGRQWTGGTYLKPRIFLTAYNRQTGIGSLYSQYMIEGWPGVPQRRPLDFNGYAADIQGILDSERTQNQLFIATSTGTIFESNDNGLTWSQEQLDENAGLYSNLVLKKDIKEPGYKTTALAVLKDGKILINGFEFTNSILGINERLNPGLDEFWLEFTNIPDLATVQSGLTVRSNYSGRLFYSAQYAPSDSHRILLSFNRVQSTSSIPGESWNISMDGNLLDRSAASNTITPLNYDASFISLPNPDFNFEFQPKSVPKNIPGSNFVTGWFNNDAFMDLITYVNGRLIIYTVQEDGRIDLKSSVDLPIRIDINQLIEKQLLSADFDLDGDPDLVLYDNDEINVILNQSTDFFYFQVAPESYLSTNIRQVGVYNADHNAQVDLLVLDNSLTTILNVKNTFAEPNLITHIEPADLGNYSGFSTGDMDANGIQDIVVVGLSDLLLLKGRRDGSLAPGIPLNHGKNYRSCEIIDLDHDHILELIAYNDTEIDAYSLNRTTFNSLEVIPGSPLASLDEGIIKSVVVEDFGQRQGDYGAGLPDILVLTENQKIKIVENVSSNTLDFAFLNQPEKEIKLEIASNEVFDIDLNRDGKLDLFTNNKLNSQFQAIFKSSWAPRFKRTEVTDQGIALSWDVFNAVLGSFDFYRISRYENDLNDQTPVIVDISNDGITDYIDKNVQKFNRYIYIIQAFYDRGIQTERSEPEIIETFLSLANPLPTAIIDSTIGYIVKNPISVGAGDSLFIGPGIQIHFENEYAFDIFGSLNIEGTEKHFVRFQGNPDIPSIKWPGLNIHPGVDTVRFKWFSVDRSVTGIQIDQRPVKFQFGSLTFNETGIRVSGDTLILENVCIDSNSVGINLDEGAGALIKHINVFHNQTAGIVVHSKAQLKLKNSILWYNQGPEILSQNGASVYISYSTIDRWEGKINKFEISHLEPLFVPPDSGYYKPALMSPTIDSGDPSNDYSLEPSPYGNRINLGLYGGTLLATATYQPQIDIESSSVRLESKPQQADTTSLIFTNMGNVPLSIYTFEFSASSKVFNIPEDATILVKPGQRVETDLVFIPEKRISYLDTLSIFSNDPHNPEIRMPLSGKGLNTLPVLTNHIPDTAWVGSEYRQAIPVFDENNDTLIYTALELPEWLSLTSNGFLMGNPGIDDTLSLHQVVVNIGDGFGESVLFSHVITVSFVNQPPAWAGLINLNYIEDLRPEAFDLKEFVSDENTMFDKIILDVAEIEDSSAIRATISDHHLLNIQLTADYFNSEPSRILISATDREGLTSFDSVLVKIDGVEDAPRFKAVPDTTIYTDVLLYLPLKAWDVDRQEILFNDDTELFDVHPDTGIIKFRPAPGDTGSYSIGLSFSDGVKTVKDTFSLQVKLNPVKSPFGFTFKGFDQAAQISFSMPELEYYTGTRIYYSKLANIGSPNTGTLALDTTIIINNNNKQVSLVVSDLEIAQEYYISIFNYFYKDGYIYSPPLQGEVQTLLPLLEMESTELLIPLAVNRDAEQEIKIRNSGGGTMYVMTTYQADSLTNIWFDSDTTRKKVLPGDSTSISVFLHPNRNLERRDYIQWLYFNSNDPENNRDSLLIVMEPIFDEYAPDIRILSRPDSLVREAAVYLQLSADDTTGRPIGDPEEDILKSYQCINMATSEIVFQKDSIKTDFIMLYPLDDGIYQLRIWGYDIEGNGRLGSRTEYVDFVVEASNMNVPAKKWFMVTIPRLIPFRWEEFVSDSLVKLYRWNNTENSYFPVLFSNQYEHMMGNTFWLYPNRPVNISVQKYPQATSKDSLITDIVTGWNQVGLPIAYKTFWKDMWFRSNTTNVRLTLKEAIEQEIISPAVYWYKQNKDYQGYEWGILDTVIAEPWRGYWLRSNENGKLIYTRLPAFQTNISAMRADSTEKLNRKSTDWHVEFDLHNEIYNDRKNILGISSADKRYPIFEPPHLSEYCSFFYESEFGPLTCFFQEPFKDLDEVKYWGITIETRSMHLEHELNWSYDSNQSDFVYLYLVDNQREEIVDMSDQTYYKFLPSTGTYSFAVYATQDASFLPKIVPLEYKLAQNFPNPFNPRTRIRFGIPEPADGQLVTLKVYNVLGQEIATLVNENLDMGYHEAEWNSTNMSGQLVSSGVYFYKLSTGKDILVRKMILVR